MKFKMDYSDGKGRIEVQNIDADDLPSAVKKSFDAMVEAEATFKTDLERLLKHEGHMPEDKFLAKVATSTDSKGRQQPRKRQAGRH
jgi:hypothetical protein